VPSPLAIGGGAGWGVLGERRRYSAISSSESYAGFRSAGSLHESSFLRTIASPASERQPLAKSRRLPMLAQWFRPMGATIASIKRIPLPRRGGGCPSKPRAEPQSCNEGDPSRAAKCLIRIEFVSIVDTLRRGQPIFLMRSCTRRCKTHPCLAIAPRSSPARLRLSQARPFDDPAPRQQVQATAQRRVDGARGVHLPIWARASAIGPGVDTSGERDAQPGNQLWMSS